MVARKRASRKRSRNRAPQEPREIDGLYQETADDDTLGPEVLVRASGMPPMSYLSTGIFALDYLLYGGLPRGRSTMVYGNEGCGKSTLAALTVAEHQRRSEMQLPAMGGEAAWVDAERMFDPAWTEKLYVDNDMLHIVQPKSGQEGVNMIDALMRVKEIGLIVIDSVPALVPQVIIEQAAEDKTMGQLAALMGVLCSKIMMAWNEEKRRGHFVTVIFINQWRSKVGLVFGDPRSLPGGRQLNYHMTNKIELFKKEIVPEKGDNKGLIMGNEHTFKLAKQKGAWARDGAFSMALSDDWMPHLTSGQVDNVTSIATFAKKAGLISGGGRSWRIHGVSERFPNLNGIREFLVENGDVQRRLAQSLIVAKRIEGGLAATPPDDWLYGGEVTDVQDTLSVAEG